VVLIMTSWTLVYENSALWVGVRGFLNPMDDNNVGVAQGGKDLGFTFKQGYVILVPGQGLRQDLDGDVTVELGVGGTVDFTHAALPIFSVIL